jgi:hypothetical protein
LHFVWHKQVFQSAEKLLRLQEVHGEPCLTGSTLAHFSMEVLSTCLWCFINVMPSLHKFVLLYTMRSGRWLTGFFGRTFSTCLHSGSEPSWKWQVFMGEARGKQSTEDRSGQSEPKTGKRRWDSRTASSVQTICQIELFKCCIGNTLCCSAVSSFEIWYCQ